VPEIRHLEKAPITEAIFDFRVNPADDFQAETFANLKAGLSDRFPKSEERRNSQMTIGFKPGEPAVVNSEDLLLEGIFYKSQDEKLIAQFRANGFTLNRLAPYTSWDELFPVARLLWMQYCETSNPQAVSRLGLRYINQFALPWAHIDFGDYLRAGPNLPSGLPQTVPAFNLQVLLLDEKSDIAARVSQRLETSLVDKKYTVILDIDAYKIGSWLPDDPSIETLFGQLRDFKNQIFFNYLTEKTIGSFV
jgi:uncharacterized protein (TIGR04255 family)